MIRAIPPSPLLLNFESLLSQDLLAHVYKVDKQGILVAANDLQLEIIKQSKNLLSKNAILGKPLKKIFQKNEGNLVNIALQQNQLIISTEETKNFHEIWRIKSVGEVELFTIKMPYYENNSVAGILGISYYLSKISFPEKYRLGLSNRETECLTFLLEGLSQQKIADKMGVSPRTVESYLNSSKSKLGCISKAELIAKTLLLKEDYLKKNTSIIAIS